MPTNGILYFFCKYTPITVLKKELPIYNIRFSILLLNKFIK